MTALVVASVALLRLAPPAASSRLAAPAAAARRLAHPLMQYPPDYYQGSVVPNAAAMSLQEKVETLRKQLSIRRNLPMSECVDKALVELGLQGFEALSVVDKVDACLDALGIRHNFAVPRQYDQYGPPPGQYGPPPGQYGPPPGRHGPPPGRYGPPPGQYGPPPGQYGPPPGYEASLYEARLRGQSDGTMGSGRGGGYDGDRRGRHLDRRRMRGQYGSYSDEYDRYYGGGGGGRYGNERVQQQGQMYPIRDARDRRNARWMEGY